MNDSYNPGYRVHYNINRHLVAHNQFDKDENPTGGDVILYTPPATPQDDPAVFIRWQNGPRGRGDGVGLASPNGAFVEDVLWAALQRLEFFQQSKYVNRANAMAITHIEQAIQALKDRQLERSFRNVEGKHEV